MSSAGVGPLCFLKSTVNTAIYQDILEHFMLPSADKLYGDADFIFQQDLAPAHTAKGTKSWFNDHGESMEYCQEEDERHQTKQCRWPEGCHQSNLGFYYTWAVPQAYCLHATPHWCSNSCKRSPNLQVLSRNEHTDISVENILFVLILFNIQIFGDTEFWVFIICKP